MRAVSDPVSRGGAFEVDSAAASTGLLAQETNPFEQSFQPQEKGQGDKMGVASIAATRSVSASGTNAAVVQSGISIRTAAVPFSIGTSAGQELSSAYGWGSNSLRSGPLSPSLLSGPAHNHLHSGPPPGLYDPSVLRTSLQPLSGPGNSAFPPPSPGTAALFAMMTNNTPGAGGEGSLLAVGGNRSHETGNEGNHFDASFARAALVPQYQQQQSQQQQHQHYRSMPTQHLPSLPSQYQHQQQQQQDQPPPHNLRQPGGGGGGNGGGGTQNPLYLLSQAQDHEAAGAANALKNLSGPSYASENNAADEERGGGALVATSGGGAGEGSSTKTNAVVPAHLQVAPVMGRGGDRGAVGSTSSSTSHAIPPPPAPTPVAAKGKKGAVGKRRKSAAAADYDETSDPPPKKGRKVKAVPKDEDSDDFDDQMGLKESLSPLPHNPNETEEEKRKNFLERNRQGKRLSLYFCFSFSVVDSWSDSCVQLLSSVVNGRRLGSRIFSLKSSTLQRITKHYKILWPTSKMKSRHCDRFYRLIRVVRSLWIIREDVGIKVDLRSTKVDSSYIGDRSFAEIYKLCDCFVVSLSLSLSPSFSFSISLSLFLTLSRSGSFISPLDSETITFFLSSFFFSSPLVLCSFSFLDRFRSTRLILCCVCRP